MAHDSHPAIAYPYAPIAIVARADDLTVQTLFDSGFWHRRAIGGRYTACGETINHKHAQELRHEAYDGKICRDGCFSMFELALSEQANRDQKEDER
jgi:hypothetical protein